jgi:hypothetical protein
MKLAKIRPFILPLLAAIVIGAVTFEFSSRSLTPVREETSQSLQQAETIRKQTVQGRAALQDDARISEANTRAIAMLPDEPQLSEVIAQIDALARANRMQWTAGAPAATPVTDADVPAGMLAWTMSANFNGPIAGMYKFLDGLDTIDRLVGIQSVTMQQSGNEYAASFVLRFYALGA